jgi:hypothetical protein
MAKYVTGKIDFLEKPRAVKMLRILVNSSTAEGWEAQPIESWQVSGAI